MADIWSPRRSVLFGLAVLVFGVGAFLAWAALTEINGAVVASGFVEVKSRRQVVQHRDGGIVAEILVHDGDRVARGGPIIRLDDTQLRAQEKQLRRQLFEAEARLDRLAAEIRGTDALRFREGLRDAARRDKALEKVLADEAALFQTRQMARKQMLSQLDERKTQTRALVSGRKRQLAAGRKQLALINRELETQQNLLERGLAQASRVSALEREAARLDGMIGELEAGIAEAKSTIAGYEIERLANITKWRETAQGDLRALQPRAADLRERLRVVETRLSRLTLKAPMAGIVYGMRVFTVGAVVPPGGQVAEIVPADAPLVLSVRIGATQIDRVKLGQKAVVKFPSFASRIAADYTGSVKYISADAVTDPKTGRRFYLSEIALSEQSERALSSQRLLPGMPVQAFIQTGAHSPLSFLLKPFMDYLDYAFREK